MTIGITPSTGTWKVTVYDNFVVGSISEDQTFCESGTPDELIGVAPTGGNTTYTYQWEISTDGTSFLDVSGATDLNYQPGELTDNTYYRLEQTSASSCGTLTTNTVTITIHNLCCDPEVNFCQGPDPITNTALVSDIASGTKIYDNFWGIIGGITKIEWWGSTVTANGDNYCSENPKSFVISFYRDNGGTVGEVYKTFDVTATGTNTGSTYGTNDIPIMVYSYQLSTPFSGLTEGWVSIQGNPSSSCKFAWVTSPYGDGKSFIDGSRGQLTDDFAFGLTTDPAIPLANWPIYLVITTIVGFAVFRFRKKLSYKA